MIRLIFVFVFIWCSSNRALFKYDFDTVQMVFIWNWTIHCLGLHISSFSRRYHWVQEIMLSVSYILNVHLFVSNLFILRFCSQATLIVDNIHLHILPSMNPDGYSLRKRGNANNIDLNRDFPDQVSWCIVILHIAVYIGFWEIFPSFQTFACC